MEAIAEPQHQRRARHLRLRIQVRGADGAVELLEHAWPSGNVTAGRRRYYLPTGFAARSHLPAQRGGFNPYLPTHRGGFNPYLPTHRGGFNSELHSQPRQRGLDQEARLSVTADLAIQVQQRVE